jgi:cytochrome c oxidase subunit 2
MFTSTSQYAHNVDFVMALIVGISVVLLLGITFTMIWFIVKYNHKKNPVAKQIKNHTLLEVIWIVVPLIIVMVMFYYGYVVFMEGRVIPKNSMKIQVEARMWSWKFTYPNGKVTDTLFVPQGENIVFEITSADVVHSFYLPAFRIKEDAVSYKPTKMFIKPDVVGAYDVACAEYCGMNHSIMYTTMYVVPKKEYEKWYQGLLTNNQIRELISGVSPTKTVETGRYAILESKGCKQCHSFDGTKSIGPSFAELSRKESDVLVDKKPQKVPIDEAYLEESIKFPNNKIAVGYEKVPMPDQMNILKDEEIQQIIKVLMENFVNRNP